MIATAHIWTVAAMITLSHPNMSGCRRLGNMISHADIRMKPDRICDCTCRYPARCSILYLFSGCATLTVEPGLGHGEPIIVPVSVHLLPGLHRLQLVRQGGGGQLALVIVGAGGGAVPFVPGGEGWAAGAAAGTAQRSPAVCAEGGGGGGEWGGAPPFLVQIQAQLLRNAKYKG
jgi:hypothetical protein